MSITVMSALWKTCLYQGNTLNVLLAMADWAEDDGGDIFPGIELLAAKARASVRTTQMALRQLEADQVIERIANPTGGRGKITEYKIDLERVQELQGLHEAENPACDHCQAKRKSAEKRVQYRAQRVQAATVKGADRRQKGANPVEHIDNTHQHPSDTHHSQAPAGAGESDRVAPLRSEPGRWRDFKKAVTETWPFGLEQRDEAKAEAEFVRQTQLEAADVLIAAARMHGKAECDRKSRYRGADFRTKLASTWLKDGSWRGFAEEVRQGRQREADAALALARVVMALPAKLIEMLRSREMADASIAMLDGVSFEPGPPPLLIVRSGAQRLMLDRHRFALERHFGEGFEIIFSGERQRA